MPSTNHLPKVGVCVHPAFGLVPTVKAMTYLGLSRVRYDTPLALSAYETGLCDAGLDACCIVSSFGDGTPKDMLAQLASIRALELRRSGGVSAIEGPNEVNNQPVHWAGVVDPEDGDLAHRTAAQGFIAALHAAVLADPVLRHIPVIAHTDTVPTGAAGAAYANIHVYAHDEGPLDWWLQVDGLSKLQAANPGMPWFVTEWGDRLINGKTQAQQAENILQGVLTHAAMGTAAHYIYALFDDASGAYGLFNANGTPRTAATSLRWLVALLEDAAPVINGPALPQATFSSTPAPQGSLIVPKSDGSFLHFIWPWNPPTARVDYAWSLDRAVQVHGQSVGGGEWGIWHKAVGERQDWTMGGPGDWAGIVPLRLVLT